MRSVFLALALSLSSARLATAGSESSVTGVTPTVVSNGSEFEQVTISGSGFIPGLTMWFEHPPGTPIIGVGADQIGPGGTTATAIITPAGAPLGVYDIVAKNPGGPEMRLPDAFTIAAPPQINFVVPSAAPDTGVVTIVVYGASFESAATMKLGRQGAADIPGIVVAIDPAGMAFGADFDLRGRTAGLWDVVLTNPSGLSAVRSNGFTIQAFPILTSIEPSIGVDLGPIGMVISGAQFSPGVTARLERPSVPAIIGAVYFNQNGQIGVQFDLANASVGLYDVVVTNPGNLATRLSAAFEVYTIAFTPGYGYDSTQVACTITGRDFDLNAAPELISPSSPIILGTGTVVAADRNSITTTFDLRDQPTGPRALRILQPTSDLTAKIQFLVVSRTVLDAPPPRAARELTLASVAPNPTSGPATVTFTLASEIRVRLSVVDVLGRETAVLVDGVRPAGRHEARWDGRGRQGAAPTGMYFVRMEAGGRRFMKRFVMTR